MSQEMEEQIPNKKSKTKENEENDVAKSMEEEENLSKCIITDVSANATTLVVPTTPLPSTTVQQRPKIQCKDPKFSYIEPGGKRFIWKSLKQIITQERSLPWEPNIVLYNSLNAPPSLKPAKKYSDISGLEAPYTDPQTKLHYHNGEEFRIIRTLPSDIIQGYLALRGATNIVG